MRRCVRPGTHCRLAMLALMLVAPAVGSPPDDEPKPDEPVMPVRRENLPRPHSIRPRPRPAIPDDPPPHEGALIDDVYVIEPPDLLLVEVLEALPGRPISGERLSGWTGLPYNSA